METENRKEFLLGDWPFFLKLLAVMLIAASIAQLLGGT